MKDKFKRGFCDKTHGVNPNTVDVTYSSRILNVDADFSLNHSHPFGDDGS